MYLTQQRQCTSDFHKIYKQKHCSWMILNKLYAKSVVLLHKYIHRDVCVTHQLCIINDAQLMTENVINDALLQAMPHIKHRLIQFFGVMKLCLWHTSCHISNQILQSSGFRSGLSGACDVDIPPLQERHVMCQSFVFLAQNYLS